MNYIKADEEQKTKQAYLNAGQYNCFYISTKELYSNPSLRIAEGILITQTGKNYLQTFSSQREYRETAIEQKNGLFRKDYNNRCSNEEQRLPS